MSADHSPNQETIKAMLRHELLRGPSHQGGHSDEGLRISRILGVGYPLEMKSLVVRARELGYSPTDLWPWYDPT